MVTMMTLDTITMASGKEHHHVSTVILKDLQRDTF